MLRLATILLAALLTLVGNSCTPFHPIMPNNVELNLGEVIGADVKQAFLSIATEEKWSLSIEYTTPEGVADWCRPSKSSGEGSANVLLSFGANTLEEERSLILTISFASSRKSISVTQRSKYSTDAGDLSGWLELPAFAVDNERYYHSRHMLPSTGNRERSFSIYYDADYYLPLWVAYPLCYGNIEGSGSRVNDWGILDPNIPEEKQLYMKYSYNGSYDRGHMLPSASRLGSNDDNRQTFYPTNMTPQLSGLNQKKWATIEGQVRDWAYGCDTLYVVTGAVVQTAGGDEPINYTYCKSDSSKQVAIPNYYYKALLQYRKPSTYQAIAIWVPHKAATGAATLNDVMTIDELEELTGLDFFVGLDDAIEARVESKTDNLYWRLQ